MKILRMCLIFLAVLVLWITGIRFYHPRVVKASPQSTKAAIHIHAVPMTGTNTGNVPIYDTPVTRDGGTLTESDTIIGFSCAPGTPGNGICYIATMQRY